MLADRQITSTRVGSLNSDVQKPGTFCYEVLDFIANELPRWRDNIDRPEEQSETVLTSQLCRHLNGASRHSTGFDNIQFLTEEPDEKQRQRHIDLAAAPCGTDIYIDGRRHTEYDSIMPIECKRLPTPKEKDRDEREYVTSRFKTTGGIQRFKDGDHGSTHTFAAMIGYVQKETTASWERHICTWIKNLANSEQPGWSDEDLLHSVRSDPQSRIARLRSSHKRVRNLSDIQLHHILIEMKRN